MVSLWPWKGDTDAASFEKALSTLATKISKNANKADVLRQRARRVKVMWTLYTIFAWILAALILTLVTGWQNWGTVEYTGLAGGPVVIYGVRKALTAFYDYRIANTQAYLDNLYKERDNTIEKLKAATKYNSTQQLLEKYGSSPKPTAQKPSPSPGGKRKSPGNQKGPIPQPGRTNMPPPPTANIQRSQTQPPAPSNPQPPASTNQSHMRGPAGLPEPPYPPQEMVPGAEFAPNAFNLGAAPPPSATNYAPVSQNRWYDRIMDVLLGEDETQPKNRLALICSNCRLVNGQAPPGTKSLEEVGRWRCFQCGAWNGQESDTQRLVEKISEEVKSAEGASTNEPSETEEEMTEVKQEQEDTTSDVGGDSVSSGVDLSSTPAKSTRSRSKGKKK